MPKSDLITSVSIAMVRTSFSFLHLPILFVQKWRNPSSEVQDLLALIHLRLLGCPRLPKCAHF